MSVLKSLVGGLIGAALATVIYYFAKPQMESFSLWFPVLAGALTGIVAGMFGGSSRSRGERLTTGIVSAFVAAVTIFGADVVLSQIKSAEIGNRLAAKKAEQEISRKSEAKTTAEESSESSEKADAKTSAESEKSGEEKGEAAPTPLDSGSKSAIERGENGEPVMPVVTPQQKEMSAQMIAEIARKRKINEWLQIILPGVGIFLAYQFARGFQNKPAEK